MNVVLFEPEIPPNTGNIARLCVATRATLHLVGKLGFSLEDRYLRRAGLDHWEQVELRVHQSLEELHESAPRRSQFFYVSKRGKVPYTKLSYRPDDYLVFGNETSGLPPELLEANYDRTIHIPMFGPARCLNLSNAVAVVLYEALRQTEHF